jgi:hypothetical protein
MYRILTTLGLIGLGTQAFALSCVPPNPASSFNHYQEQPEKHLIGIGTLQPAEALPERQSQLGGAAKDVSVTYNFAGRFLSRRGLGFHKETEVRVTSECLSAWCGQFPDTPQEVMVFVERQGDSLHLALSPCGGSIFPKPFPEQLEALQSCFPAQKCRESVVRLFSR